MLDFRLHNHKILPRVFILIAPSLPCSFYTRAIQDERQEKKEDVEAAESVQYGLVASVAESI